MMTRAHIFTRLNLIVGNIAPSMTEIIVMLDHKLFSEFGMKFQNTGS